MNQPFRITLNLSSSTPIYVQIADCVVSGIATGKLKAGDTLPSSRQLAKLLGINYHTINKGYEVLIREGYIFMDRRKRLFVGEKGKGKVKGLDPRWTEKVKKSLMEALSKGLEREEILNKIGEILDSVSENEADK